jgi:hypothetical protein
MTTTHMALTLVEARGLRIQRHHHRALREQRIRIRFRIRPIKRQRDDPSSAENVPRLLLLVNVVDLVLLRVVRVTDDLGHNPVLLVGALVDDLRESGHHVAGLGRVLEIGWDAADQRWNLLARLAHVQRERLCRNLQHLHELTLPEHFLLARVARLDAALVANRVDLVDLGQGLSDEALKLEMVSWVISNDHFIGIHGFCTNLLLFSLLNGLLDGARRVVLRQLVNAALRHIPRLLDLVDQRLYAAKSLLNLGLSLHRGDLIYNFQQNGLEFGVSLLFVNKTNYEGNRWW